MIEWWNELTLLNQVLFASAGVFSLVFIWQFLAALIGLSSGGADVDVDADLGAGDADLDAMDAQGIEDAGEADVSFQALSIRSILAFLTMFCWAGALYLYAGYNVSISLTYAAIWGVAGWLIVALLIFALHRLAETGTARLSSCLGKEATVYVNIPPDGAGQVRTLIGGVMTTVHARTRCERPLPSGTPVRVTRRLDAVTVEVEPIAPQGGDDSQST